MIDDEDIGDPDFWKRSGDLCFRQARYEDAIRCYHESISIYPGNIPAWNNLGFALFRAGRPGEAAECRDRVSALKEAREKAIIAEDNAVSGFSGPAEDAAAGSAPSHMNTGELPRPGSFQDPPLPSPVIDTPPAKAPGNRNRKRVRLQVLRVVMVLSVIALVFLSAAVVLSVLGMAGSVAYSPDETLPTATVAKVPPGLPISLPADIGTLQWRELIVDNCTWVTEPGGARYLAGTVKNAGPLDYPYVQIVIHFYDDNLTAVGRGEDSGRNFSSGGTWQFRVPAPGKTATEAEIREVAVYV